MTHNSSLFESSECDYSRECSLEDGTDFTIIVRASSSDRAELQLHRITQRLAANQVSADPHWLQIPFIALFTAFILTLFLSIFVSLLDWAQIIPPLADIQIFGLGVFPTLIRFMLFTTALITGVGWLCRISEYLSSPRNPVKSNPENPL